MRKKLTKSEKSILDSFERGEWQDKKLTPNELKSLKLAASLTETKDKRINIRIPTRVLEGIQIRAYEEGLPYQTLIASILHKYVTGKLVNKNN